MMVMRTMIVKIRMMMVSAIGIAMLMREYAVHADYAHEDENLIHICKAL